MSNAQAVFTGVMFLIIAVGVFGSIVIAISRMWKEYQPTPDDDAGAPEGATIIPFIPEPRHPSR